MDPKNMPEKELRELAEKVSKLIKEKKTQYGNKKPVPSEETLLRLAIDNLFSNIEFSENSGLADALRPLINKKDDLKQKYSERIGSGLFGIENAIPRGEREVNVPDAEEADLEQERIKRGIAEQKEREAKKGSSPQSFFR